jgi:hypothetical protein
MFHSHRLDCHSNLYNNKVLWRVATTYVHVHRGRNWVMMIEKSQTLFGETKWTDAFRIEHTYSMLYLYLALFRIEWNVFTYIYILYYARIFRIMAVRYISVWVNEWINTYIFYIVVRNIATKSLFLPLSL